MPVSFSRRCLVLAGLVLLAAAALLPPAPAQQPGKAPPPAVEAPGDTMPFSAGLLLPAEPNLPRKLEAVRDYVQAKAWPEAAGVLQELLESPHDAFVSVKERGADGQETVRFASARAEAARLIGELPRAGLTAYELIYGPKAQELLAAAKNEPERLDVVVRRYPHTKAGADAAARLGAYHLDRGRYGLAAGYLDLALRSAASETPSPLVLLKAALAYRRAGGAEKADATWKRLASEAPDGVAVGPKVVPLDELEKELQRPAVAQAVGAGDWPVFGGDAGRSAEASGATFDPAPRWQKPTVRDGVARTWVLDAVRQQQAASQPVLSGSFPITAGGKVIFRTHRGVAALDARSGETAWESPSALGLDALTAEPAWHAHVGAWVNGYLAGRSRALLENSVLGSLSSDGARVYAVEDLPVPPFPTSYSSFALKQGQGWEFASAPELTDALYHSRLLAIDLHTGRVVWEAGGRSAPGEARGGGRDFLHDCFFLGPPLPLGGKLYAVVQKGFDLCLACLDPLDGRLAWSQRLAISKSRLVLDGGRRTQALHVAYGDGLLVCPTNAGGVVAFDLVSHRLAWAQAYREEPPPPPAPQPPFNRMRPPRPRPVIQNEPPNLTALWKGAAPVVSEGRVVVPSVDGAELHCLDLREGKLIWKADWTTTGGPGNVFLAAVHGGKALVAGDQGVVALGLADGKRVWWCETGLPAGRGSVAGGAYHLPVRRAVETGKPEVWAIDVEKGTVRSRVAVAEGEPLGNLVFHQGAVLSQSATLVAAYGPAK
jgi:outer membrane protein assembly factor BamB